MNVQEGIATFQLLFVVLTLIGVTIAFGGSYMIWREWLREAPADRSIWIANISRFPNPIVQQELRDLEARSDR